MNNVKNKKYSRRNAYIYLFIINNFNRNGIPIGMSNGNEVFYASLNCFIAFTQRILKKSKFFHSHYFFQKSFVHGRTVKRNDFEILRIEFISFFAQITCKTAKKKPSKPIIRHKPLLCLVE